MNEELLLEQIIELLEAKNYHKLRPLLENIPSADIALLLSELPEESLPVVFRLLPKDLASDVFVEMDADYQEVLITSFSDLELKAIFDDLFLDDTVDILEEMPANVVKRILRHTNSETRDAINDILKYPKDSAGSIMTIEYVTLKADMSVADAFDKIRKTGVDKETIYTCYVTDDKRNLIGVVTVKTLLLNPMSVKIADIMETNIVSINTFDDKEEAARSFDKYNYLAIPVVDGEGKMAGIITVDDAMDVMRQASTEDISKMAAISSPDNDKPYLKTGVFHIFKSRVMWLMLLMISATLTGWVISSNEAVLSAASYGIILTACIPMITGTGGNAGSQASVTVIRGIALGEVEFSDIFKVVWKEFRVSVMLGLVLSVVCFGKLMLVNRLYAEEQGYMIAATICITMFLTVIMAKLIGCCLPLLAKKIGLDPAVMASPFISTIVDTLSLLVFCGVAIGMLH